MAERTTRTQAVLRAEQHPAFVEASAWLASIEARRRAAAMLHRCGLQGEPADVAQDALHSLWCRLDRNPETTIDDVPAYCTVVMRNVVRSTLRGFDADPIDDVDDLADQPRIDLPSDPHLEGDLRTAIESLGGEVWVAAAAINFVTLTAHPQIDISDSPAPIAGATPDEQRIWPSLWFAGKRDGFPDFGRYHAAKRKRLSRAGQLVRERLGLARTLVMTERRDG